MTAPPADLSGDPRILATLERILVVQTELLAEIRDARQAGAVQVAEGLELQRQAAARSQIAIETQRSSARLYRIVVFTLAAILVAAVAAGIYFSIVG